MKRGLALFIVLIGLLCTATGAGAFDWNLPDWSFPTYDWSSLNLKDPNTWPFMPVPEVTTDPNGGTTVGLLPVFLFTDHNDQIRNIFAPDFNVNTTLGPGGNFRYLSYPSSDTQWYVTGGGNWTIARQVDLNYETGRDRTKWWSFQGRFYFERDPTERFYGLGNNSARGNETNFTTEQVYGQAALGINFTKNLQLQIMEKPRYVRILRGGFTNLPTIFQLFPNQKGVDGGTEVLNQVMLTYDTRDSVDIPRDGGVARIFYAVADRRFLSSQSFNRFGGELRRYVPITRNITLAGHLFMEYEPAGNEMPFWAQARLGGDQSDLVGQQETLRGYGTGRYVDNNLVVANLEMRTRVYEANLFGTHGILEVAPFAEAGRVAHQMSYNPVSAVHPAGGIGFRGIAEPFVVGFVDVGYGNEGAAIFSGINYPF
ncbi:MAG TPA: BamA/TamA family outer membrane protein [Candidatus Binataceae bacterium]